MTPAPNAQGLIDPHRTRDHLGRIWSHDKLDELLTDPEVAELVDEMEAAWVAADGNYSLVRARTWAHGRSRSEAELALLIMLWYRRLVLRTEASS